MSAQAPSSFRAAAIHERFDMNIVLERARNASSKYGAQSVSLVAVKPSAGAAWTGRAPA